MLNDEIIEQRRGNITASAAHRIMAGWDTPRPTDEFPPEIYDWIERWGGKPTVGRIKEELDCEVSAKLIEAAWKAYRFDTPPQGLLTYAEELACDELFEHDPSTEFTSTHMENGNEREVEAMERLSTATGMHFQKTGDDQIHISIDGIGCTADGLVYDELDLIVTGGEAKCRSPIHHARQLLIRDNASLIEHDFSRFCQTQVCCLVTGADEWYSASFNPYAIREAHKFHYCVIKRDTAFLSVFKKRADMVFRHKAEFMAQLNEIGRLRAAA